MIERLPLDAQAPLRNRLILVHGDARFGQRKHEDPPQVEATGTRAIGAAASYKRTRAGCGQLIGGRPWGSRRVLQHHAGGPPSVRVPGRQRGLLGKDGLRIGNGLRNEKNVFQMDVGTLRAIGHADSALVAMDNDHDSWV